MSFLFNLNTKIHTETETKPVMNAINILKRDMAKVFGASDENGNDIHLKKDDTLDEESYKIDIAENIVISAADDLGFVYALLKISEKYLDIKPFWFWLDQKIEKKDSVRIEKCKINSPKPKVKYRGWFFNDEVLMMKWKINGDKKEPWRMAFETLLRCGGNMTIPGTDKNSRLNRQMAADMGLWITHHHAEPLGAEIFARAYPGVEANFMEKSELFYKLWEDAVIEQKDCNVIWNLCFRGQGDCPFWSNDTSGQFDTPQKRGKLISNIIKKQCDIVKKYVKNPVFCTNLYGEIMELYKDGYIELDDCIIKVKADNGYGKMVTRRRDNHTARVSSMPVKDGGRQGIYYHVSFYDLQAANHITMLPNTVDFVNRELSDVLENGGDDFWVINCSNVRPHTYYLDAVRKKWFGEDISDESHSKEFADDYFNSTYDVSKCLAEYPKSTIKFGKNEDEHAGEQFYTENVRIIANKFVKNDKNSIAPLNWLVGKGGFYSQVRDYKVICESGIDKINSYYEMCKKTSEKLSGNEKQLFDETVFLQAKIHYYCANGVIKFCNGIEEFEKENYKEAFLLCGDSAVLFDKANEEMRNSENGVWQGFYHNDCLADIKHTAYMARKVMGVIREFGDNIRHDKWYRETMYAPEDREVMLLLVLDNHMTDEELYKAMQE